VTLPLAGQAVLAVAAYLARPFLVDTLPQGIAMLPAPFLDDPWPALAVNGVLLALLLRLSGDAAGAPGTRSAPAIVAAAPHAMRADAIRADLSRADGAAPAWVQPLGAGLLGVFAALLLATAWQALALSG
jgi:hypothetical protein